MENTLITNDRLTTFSRHAHKIPDGFIAEVGVYKGGSLKYLSELFLDREIFGFDTFAGLPKEQWTEAEHHEPGEFNDTSLEDVKAFINSEKVFLYKGMFPDSIPAGLEVYKYALVHIDTDFYLSVKACLEWFWPRMASGGIIVLDDYGWPNCPGVKQALEEFNQPYLLTADYQAAIIKP